MLIGRGLLVFLADNINLFNTHTQTVKAMPVHAIGRDVCVKMRKDSSLCSHYLALRRKGFKFGKQVSGRVIQNCSNPAVYSGNRGGQRSGI